MLLACPLILWYASFRNEEFKLMLSYWVTVFACPRAISFHVSLMVCKRGAGFLPFILACLELWTRQAFPTSLSVAQLDRGRVTGALGWSVLPEWIPSHSQTYSAWSSTTTTCFHLMELNGLTHDLCNNPNTFESAQIYLSLPSKAPEFIVILQWSRSYPHNCQRFTMAGRGN